MGVLEGLLEKGLLEKGVLEKEDGSPGAVPAHTIFHRMPATTRGPETLGSCGILPKRLIWS